MIKKKKTTKAAFLLAFKRCAQPLQREERMDSYRILFSQDTSLIRQDGGDISSTVRSVGFFFLVVRGLPGDGWRARRRTPALLLRHLIISKGSAGPGMIPYIR